MIKTLARELKLLLEDLRKMGIEWTLMVINSLDMTRIKINGWMYYHLEFNNVVKWLIKIYAITPMQQMSLSLKISMICCSKKNITKNLSVLLQE